MIKWINKYKNRITALSGFLIIIGFALKTLGYVVAADYALILQRSSRWCQSCTKPIWRCG